MIRIFEVSDAFMQWCRTQALATWARRGIDPKGGFFERLSQDGQPDTLMSRRSRVHFRQLYVFSHARHLGWWGDPDDRVGQAGMAYARSNVLSPDGSIPLMMGPDGQPADTTRDLYSHAFILLSMAWRYRAANDAEALAIAERTLAFLDDNMASPHGGWIEQLPVVGGLRRQNPHMHFFEAFLALYDVTRDQKWLERAGQIFDLFRKHFFDPASACLLEYFEDDWVPHASSFERVEPGHMMEWVWLLICYAEHSGEDVSAYVVPMFEVARRLGTDARSGFLVDEVHVDGRHVKASRRSWPQTEFIKAAVALTFYTDADYTALVAELTQNLMATYLSGPFEGGWFDSYDGDGKVVPGPVSASTLYHLLIAAAEVERLANHVRMRHLGSASVSEPLSDVG